MSTFGIFLCASDGDGKIKSKWLRQVGGRGRELVCSNNWGFQKRSGAQGSSVPSLSLLCLKVGSIAGCFVLSGEGTAALAQDPRGNEHPSLWLASAGMLELVAVLIGLFIICGHFP